MATIEEIMRRAPQHLAPGGTLQLVMRKGANRALDLMKEAFGDAHVALRKKGYTVGGFLHLASIIVRFRRGPSL